MSKIDELTWFYPQETKVICQHKEEVMDNAITKTVLFTTKKGPYPILVDRTKMIGYDFMATVRDYGVGNANVATYLQLQPDEAKEFQHICAIKNPKEYVKRYEDFHYRIIQKALWYNEKIHSTITNLWALAVYDVDDTLLMYARTDPHKTIEMHRFLTKHFEFTSDKYKQKIARWAKNGTFWATARRALDYIRRNY